MKCFTSYERYNPNTVSGEMIVVTQIYSSFDKKAMDVLENALRSSIGDGVKMDFKYATEGDDAEMSEDGEYGVKIQERVRRMNNDRLSDQGA